MASHRLFGRQLSRDSEHRKAMRRNLVQSLFEHGKVRTTLPKAKEVKAMAERLITEARKNTLLARRRVIAELQDRRLVDENQDFITDGAKTVIQRLFTDIAPKFVGRQGGYTRIIKLPEHRIGDGGDLVLLQLLTDEAATQPTAASGSGAPARSTRRSAGLRRKRNEKKHQFASKAIKKADAAAA